MFSVRNGTVHEFVRVPKCRVHGGVQFGEESFSDIDVVAGHIAAIMRKNKLTFDELSKSEILPQLQGLTNGS